jgi:TonB-linked SusC/RagA family outer membrane protein
MLFFLLTCGMLQVHARAFAQHEKVSVRIENVSLKVLFKELERQTGVDFLYNHRLVESRGKVNVTASDKELSRVLDELFPALGLEYLFRDNVIIVREESVVARLPQEPLVIRGKVTDEKGLALPGVSILLEGTHTGTITDARGEFSLRLPVDRGNLLVSSIGYKSQKVAFEPGKTLLIRLEEEIKEIEEVVVTGIFTRRANSYTGAIASVKGEELRRVGNANLIASLKSIDPSFMVVENLAAGSNPNALPEIQMRGQTGLSHIGNEYQNSPNQPLFILDGFEATLTKVLDLDINLIESITLLKDATAKAIYGAKAANGVVVIETVRPAKGQMKINYTGSLEVQAPDLSSYRLTNAREKVQAENRAGLYTSPSVVEQINLTRRYTELLRAVEAGVDTYWLDKPLRVGAGQKHSLYLEGGDDYMLYAIDLSYNGVSGVMKGSDRSTVSGGITLSYRVKDFLFRNKLSVDGNKSEDSPYGSFSTFTLMNPYNEIRDEDGNMIQQYTHGTVPQPNPLWNGEINTRYGSRYTYITNNTHAEWFVRENLRLIARFGFSIRASGTDMFKPGAHTDFFNYSGDNEANSGRYSARHREESNLSGDLGLAGSISKNAHLLFVNAQLSASQNKYDYYTVEAEGFPNSFMDHITSGVKYYGTRPPGAEGISREIGGMASVNYSYDDRYLFDGNYRLTGSSEFGANKRWGHFYSLGAGWNVHKEAFLSGASDYLNRLKLRVSTGYTGSQGFNSYDAIATVTYYTDKQYGGRIGSYLQGLANPDLRWQRRYDTNFGVDITAFSNRLNLRFDYYVANTKGMVSDVTTPQSVGFPAYIANIGESENRGFEAYLSARVWEERASGSFVNLFASAASNTNKLVKISNALKQYNETTDSEQDADPSNTSVKVRYEEGASTSTIWVVKSLGIDPQTGREVFVKKDGTLTETWRSSDYIKGGDALPKISGNFGVNAEYRGLGLSATFTWRTGGQLYNSTLVSKVENANVRYNVDRRVLESRWSEAGQVTRFKSIADNSYTQPTSRFIEDYNSLTFASLQLSYDFRHRDFLKNSFLQRLKASFYMNELFILSSVKTERGTDYPFARSFSFSLQANF